MIDKIPSWRREVEFAMVSAFWAGMMASGAGECQRGGDREGHERCKENAFDWARHCGCPEVQALVESVAGRSEAAEVEEAGQ